MITRHIVETVKEYNEDGKLVSEKTTETDETDDDTTKYEHVSRPITPYLPEIAPWTTYQATCDTAPDTHTNLRAE